MRTTGRAIVALVLVVGAAACTDDDEAPPPDQHGDNVALELSLGPTAGELSTEARDELQNDVAAALSTYVVDAFLGDYPREDFVGALDTFTDGVASRAAKDIELLTGAGFGDRVDGVTATRLSATISSFAPGHEAVGVTAVVDFAFDVEANGKTTEQTRTGRLMLMPAGGTWKIFGYELTPGGGS
jgi:hypothetical protein